MSRPRSSILASVGAAVLVATLLGCSAAPTSPSSTSTLTPAEVVALLEEIPGVATVDEYGDSSASIAMATDSPDDEVLAAAASIARIATDVAWPGTMSLSRENLDPYNEELDQLVRPPWTIEVFPSTERLAGELHELLLLEKLDDTAHLGVIEGWPYVSLGSIDTFAESFREVVANPLFADGGTVSLAADDRLRIVWIPKRTTISAVDAIIAISRDYPGAEVLLEATTAGPQWPTLYIARVSDEEAAAIEARLLDPALADADVDGFGLPFILRSIGSDGPTYREGNFGGVVEPG